MAGMAAPPVIPLTKIIKSHSIRSSRRHQRHKVPPPLLRMFDAHAMLGQQCGSSDMLVSCLGSCIGTSAEIQEESLQLLDWPAVCSQGGMLCLDSPGSRPDLATWPAHGHVKGDP